MNDVALANPTAAQPAAASAAMSPAMRAALLLAPLLLLFVQFKTSVDFIAQEEPQGAFVWAALVAVATLGFAAIASYRELPRYAVRFGRASAVFLVFYFAIEPFTMPRPALPPDHAAVILHENGRWVGLALGALGLWRPGFVWGGAMLLFLMRELNATVTGFYFSTLDIRNVAEVFVWVSAGHCLLVGALRWPRLRLALALDAVTAERVALFILAAGIGAHLGNYFWSALAKLALDGGPLSWLVENELRGHMLGSVEKGVLPMYASPELTQFTWDAMGLLNLPMQLASFGLQLFAIAAPWRRRWLILATFGYDLFHLFVFASLGLLFFKWICLNLIILYSVAAVREAQWDKATARVGIAFVLLGAAFFKTAMLAWYDSGNFTSAYFVAEMEDGTRHRVPSAFFASSSYQVSQGNIYVPPGSRHFEFYHFGSMQAIKDFDTAQRCRLPVREGETPARYGPLSLVGEFVGQAHRIALERADARGVFNYYPYPHHHVPWPFVPDPFYRADKRDVARYIYVLESICQTMEEGRVDRRVLLREEWPVYEVPR